MPNWLSNLVTGRAAVLALVVTVFSLLTTLGIRLPVGLSDSVSRVIDSGLVLVSVLFGASALHRGPSPEETKAAKAAQS